MIEDSFNSCQKMQSRASKEQGDMFYNPARMILGFILGRDKLNGGK